MENVRYQVATKELIYDTIEDQVILLDIRTGTYFQLTGTAVATWNWLVDGSSPADITDRFLYEYPNQKAAIELGIAEFVRELTTESLITPRTADAPAPPDAPMPAPTANSAPFVAPRLLKYTDMQSLLLLDPIHDVDAPGWPVEKTGTVE